MTALPPTLADPALGRVWSAIRDRLERQGLAATGRVRLLDLTRAERHALGVLLGRDVVRDRVTIDLAQLDAYLVERSGLGGLADVVSAAVGAPLRDRQAERAAASERRAEPYEVIARLVEADVVLREVPWVATWLAQVRRSGLLTRSPDPVELLSAAVRVLSLVMSGGAPVSGARSRVDVSAAATGDAHALDEGGVLGAIVLRGLAAAAGIDVPITTTGRRELWEQHGVSTDLVSSTCLVLGLRGAGQLERRLEIAAEEGDPVHLTPWDLRRGTVSARPGEPVLVCENPRVLEAIAQVVGAWVPVVCGNGQPALVVVDVLARLASAGAVLRYHGDLDWPGVAIANRLIDMLGVVPWRLGVADYLQALGPSRPPLLGTPVEPRWDAELGAAMRSAGVAIHEEVTLPALLRAVREEW